MRVGPVLLLLAICFAATALAWTKEDYEIFDLVSALEAAEGKGTDFYNHLGVEPSATTSEITKAYRKKSLALHPDKNPGVKNIQERFARLGVIAQILRSPEKRERYNFFHKNGVPRWRGTGYYYSRYRPTLSHTIIFLVLLTTGLHYLVQSLNYAKHQRRIAYFQRAARNAAGVGSVLNGGDKDKIVVPSLAQSRRRRVRVPMVEGNEGAGTLELVVKGDEVYIPHEDGFLEPISDLAHPPSLQSTWFPSLLLSLWGKTVSSLPPSITSSFPAFLQPHSSSHTAEVEEDDEDDDEDEGSALDTPTPAPKIRTSRALERERLKGAKGKSAKSKSNTNTPKDSPATTELESDGEDSGAGAGGKKKRLIGGKAGAARRRKMALKK